VLRQVQEVNTEGIRILRMPYTVAGKTYKAIRFQRDDFSGYQARVYDLETGLLIFFGSRVQGPSVITPPIGNVCNPGRTGRRSSYLTKRAICRNWGCSAVLSSSKRAISVLLT